MSPLLRLGNRFSFSSKLHVKLSTNFQILKELEVISSLNWFPIFLTAAIGVKFHLIISFSKYIKISACSNLKNLVSGEGGMLDWALWNFQCCVVPKYLWIGPWFSPISHSSRTQYDFFNSKNEALEKRKLK